MRKWIAIVAALLFAAACAKEYKTEIPLGVNHEEIKLPSFEEGHCFITVYSNSTWTIGFETEPDWARLGQTSGEGIDYVRLDYDENLSGAERSATVVVAGSGKSFSIVVTQPAE